MLQIKYAAVTLLILALSACIMLPIPTYDIKVLSGKPVTDEQLSFLKPLTTTKQDVIEKIGNPDIIWEDARIFVYPWDMRQGILFWATGGGYTGAAGALDIPKHHVLLIQFDEQDIVQRFEHAIRPLHKSFPVFLQEWNDNVHNKEGG